MKTLFKKIGNCFVIFLVIFVSVDFACAQDQKYLGFIGTIAKSDKRSSGEQFAFANLQSNNPVVTFPSGNSGETEKVYEDKETIVLFFLGSLTGSTEMFYLNKQRKRFTLIEVGALEATTVGKDFRPDVTIGTLK
jgi:hypothetical protein